MSGLQYLPQLAYRAASLDNRLDIKENVVVRICPEPPQSLAANSRAMAGHSVLSARLSPLGELQGQGLKIIIYNKIGCNLLLGIWFSGITLL